eukprot:5596772-Amphidinium_carterae.2
MAHRSAPLVEIEDDEVEENCDFLWVSTTDRAERAELHWRRIVRSLRRIRVLQRHGGVLGNCLQSLPTSLRGRVLQLL